MNILVLGSGGREHAIVWKLAQSPRKPKIYCIPGNPGIEQYAECIDDGMNTLQTLLDIAKEKNINLVVVGPEMPLSYGISDIFESGGIPVFGPKQKSACLESSKCFSKHLMKTFNIPTAEYEEFNDFEKAVEYVKTLDKKFVIKADGLASGKGVYICDDSESGEYYLEEIMVNKRYGESGERVIIEEFLPGEEVSFMVFTDGKTILPMTTSQDHKPVYNGNKGPNTGGMGAYSPVPFVTKELEDEIMNTIMIPTLNGLKAITNEHYVGVLYAGLKIVDGKPYVLEFNVRFGDPEAQAILMRLDTDLVDIVDYSVNGKLEEIDLKWSEYKSVCVVASSKGYPFEFKSGFTVYGLDKITGDGLEVFQSGTSKNKNKLITKGGRVLSVTALGETISDAVTRAYMAMSEINFTNIYYRDDIGLKGMGYEL